MFFENSTFFALNTVHKLFYDVKNNDDSSSSSSNNNNNNNNKTTTLMILTSEIAPLHLSKGPQASLIFSVSLPFCTPRFSRGLLRDWTQAAEPWVMLQLSKLHCKNIFLSRTYPYEQGHFFKEFQDSLTFLSGRSNVSRKMVERYRQGKPKFSGKENLPSCHVGFQRLPGQIEEEKKTFLKKTTKKVKAVPLQAWTGPWEIR